MGIMTTELRPGQIGVGMPALLHLQEFGSQVWSAFGEPPYLVGTALTGKVYRDVDVRLLLSDKDYAEQGYGHPANTHTNLKWVAMCMAFSALGAKMTGLPIDFQIQQATWAEARYPTEPRSALGLVGLRYGKDGREEKA